MFKSLNKGISTPIAIIIIIVCALIVGGVVVYQYYGIQEEEEKTPEDETPKKITVESFIIKNFDKTKKETLEEPKQKTYIDSEAGFSLEYPSSIVTGDSEEPSDLVLQIIKGQVDSFGGLGWMGYYNKEIALKDEQALDEGEFGELMDFVFQDSKKVTKIDNKYIKDFIVFSRFEVCDIVFERRVVFYNNGYQIIVVLSGGKDDIIASMVQYFLIDEKACGKGKYQWNDMDQFYQDLIGKNSFTPAQGRYDTFDGIIKTLSIY